MKYLQSDLVNILVDGADQKFRVIQGYYNRKFDT